MSKEEQKFLKNYRTSEYPPFAVTVDICLFTIREGAFSVLLVERDTPPYKGFWALPGGLVQGNESLEEATIRELREETNISMFTGHLEQLKTYGNPERDPRMRVVSVAHVAFAPSLPEPQAGSDASYARWWAVEDLLDNETTEDTPKLAFDHETILQDTIERVRAKIEYTTLAAEFLTEPFSLTELRRVYSSVWGTVPDLGNFRRKVLATEGFIVPDLEASKNSESSGGRPPTLYRKGTAKVLHPPMLQPKRV